MRRILSILIFFCFFIINESNAQLLLEGKVVDKKTLEPLELAVVTDTKTGKNALTNKDGQFVLKDVFAGGLVNISYIGYTTQQVQIARGNTPSLTIALEKGQIDLKAVTITNKTSLNAFRTLSQLDLNVQPVKSAQDLLRLVPGLFIAQHQGGGKAEQIFLRGFDADHGTDVNISADGIPVNLVSNAHGQGYADMHFIIPETVASYEFGKGPYYSDKGDFNTAGYVAYTTKNMLDENMVKIEAGQYNTLRMVAMFNLLSKKAMYKGQSFYIAAEGLYADGPFDLHEKFNRFNIFGKFITPVGSNSKLSIIASTLSSGWGASGEVPNRAVAEGYMKDRFGVIDSSQGGYTSRTNASIKLTTNLGNTTLENQLYYSHYFLNLVSNFTFYYTDPVNGDEFGQHENRDLFGYNGKLTRQSNIGDAVLTTTAGIGIRYDATHPGWLSHTLHGDSILNYIQLGRVKEMNANSYFNEDLQAGKWLFSTGIRLDYFYFYYLNMAPVSDTAAAIYNGVKPVQTKAIISPKLSIQYTANSQFQVYFKVGKGFHSNDARVVIANQGYKILPAAYGADLGINWKPAPNLFINAALWYLYLQQEFIYGSDLGDESVMPGGRTLRKGIDLSLRYQFNKWLYGNLNADLARPRNLDNPKGQNYLPLAPTFTSTAGLYFKFENGFNGGISYRYLHDRAANDSYTLTALGYFITDITANYTTRKYEIGIAIENLFNQQWNESQFEYVSRLKYEIQPVDEVSYTPGTPFFAKLKFSVFF